MNDKSPCEGCAFSPNAAANKEFHNHMVGVICLLGPLPFVCHHGQDWESPENHKLTGREVFRRGWKICEGWKREVAKLAETGYYKNSEMTRVFAQIARVELDAATSDQLDDEDKAEAATALANVLSRLYRRHEKFTGQELAGEIAKLAEEGYFTQKDAE